MSAPHQGALPSLASRVVDVSRIERAPPGYTRHFEWPAGSLTGPVDEVGRRFWEGLMHASPALATALGGAVRLTRVRLRDRYVSSPLTLRVLYEVFAHLKTAGFADDGTEFTLDTRWNRPLRNNAGSTLLPVYEGFPAQAMLRDTLTALWTSFPRGAATVHAALHHDRVLELAWPHGRLPIYLHQGVSFLRSQGAPRVTLGRDAAALAQEIRAGVYDVEMNESTTVHIGVPET